MAEYNIEGRKYLLDEDRYLQVPELWTEQTAEDLAPLLGVPVLGQDHWKIINYVRDYYIYHGLAPTMRKLVKDTGYSLEKVKDMFTSDTSTIGKISGMANPAACA